MDILVYLKKLIRQNKYLEIIAYLLQNNILYKYLNLSGHVPFAPTKENLYNYGIKIAQKYINKYPGELKNKRVLEIGVGLTTVGLHYLVKKAKVSYAIGYDRFHCLCKENEEILRMYNLSSYSDRVLYLVGDLEILQKNIEKNSLDYIVSNAVLEHVNDMESLFAVLTELLKPRGIMYHEIDLRSHGRFQKFGELYFHVFSNKLWNLMGSNVGAPNRMLLKDYVKIFEKFGLEYKINIIKTFPRSELEKAKSYLKNKNIKDYEDFVVFVKLLN